MATLILRLAAPLQSWGADSKFEVRKTNREPTKSGVIGLLAAALGIRRDDDQALLRLNGLRYGVRTDQEGQFLVDLHTARKDAKTSYLTRRYYLSDAIFLVGLESEDGTFLQELEEALRSPAFPLYLGRRSCPPTQPLCLGIRETDLLTALQTEPYRGFRSGKKRPRRLSIRIDANPQEAGSTAQQDMPISWNPTHRQYGYRAVREVLMDLPGTVEETGTEHDPFMELR